jgi:hypothetical protein
MENAWKSLKGDLLEYTKTKKTTAIPKNFSVIPTFEE